MIGKKTENVINRAIRYAVELHDEYFTLEHVFWSLLKDKAIQDVIEACGGDPDQMRLALEEHLTKEGPKVAEGVHPVPTLGIQRLIQQALIQVQSSGRTEVGPTDLLVALFLARDSFVLALLESHGIERVELLSVISHGLPSGEESNGEEDGDDDTAPAPRGPKTLGEEPLTKYTTNLNDRARAGKIDPLIGRSKEIERMVQTLCRRRKNNPLLVGEAGVGKTALAEGLALRITENKVPELLKSAVVYSLDMGSLMAGTRYRGDFEARVKEVLKALEGKRSKGEMPILFIDEIHTLVGAGAVGGGSLDAANLLKPLLSQGEIRCVGSTTYKEYRAHIEKDHALSRRFQKIDVVEPTVEEAIQILQGLQSRFEEHHQVKYTHEAIRAAVELAAKHLTDLHLPDKAIDVIDEAGARARLAGTQDQKIDAPQIEEVISQIARIPARSVSVSQKDRLKQLDRDLKLTIFGQNEAIEAVSTAIRLARSGLRTGDKPIGSFLFCGPTGVGKTELSKQLALALGVQILRHDMSEYGEKHTVSRLIGAPPGYVGFDQAGVLTDAVLKNPYAVVLLDEIEKAHPDVWNILLQVMDHGTLTDNNGRKVDFRNVVLILTSNVGSREMERKPLGMSSADADAKAPQAAAKKAVEQAFTPEFRNRLDAIVFFNPLSTENMRQVVMKQLLELETQLLSKNVEVTWDESIQEWMLKKGYDRALGARPLARLIQDRIKKPLANEILFGKLENGGRVTVAAKDDEVTFTYKSAKPPKGGSGKASNPKRESESVS